MANIDDLIQRARTIRIETKSKKNTADRIGSLLLDIVNGLGEAQSLKKAQYGGIVATSADVVSDYAAKGYSGPYFYLVGSSLNSLVVYQYAGTGTPAQAFGGAAYDFADYSEAISRLNQLGPEIRWIPKSLLRGYINRSTSNVYWDNIGSGSRYYVVARIDGIVGKTIKVKGGANVEADLFFLSSYTTPESGTNTGIISGITIGANAERTTIVPNGTTYIYLLASSYGTDRLPSNIWIDGVDLLATAKENLMNIGRSQTQLKENVDFILETSDAFGYSVGGEGIHFKYGSNRTIVVSFDNNIRIYKKDGGYIDNNISVSGLSYTLSVLNKLVYNLSDNSVEVVDESDTGEYIVLLANLGLSVNGLLMPYFVAQLCEQSKMLVYFAYNAIPSITVQKSTSIQVSIKMPTEKLYIYSTNGNKYVESTSFSGLSYTIDNNKMLVYDFFDEQIKTVTIGTFGMYAVLLTNYAGSVEGLLSKYYVQSMTNAAVAKSITVPCASKHLGFVKECYLFGNIDPTKTYRVKLIYHRYGDNSSNAIRITDSSETNVCLYQVNNVTDDDYGVLYLNQIGSSGIFGYIIVNWNELNNSVGISDANIILRAPQAYNDICNPTIYAYLTSRNDNKISKLYDTQDFLTKVINWSRGNRSGISGLPLLRLMHISDIHLTPENVIRALAIRDVYASYIDDILNTGDDVNYYSNDITSLAAVDGWEDILSVIGNHDTRGSGDDSSNWEKYAGADAYARYFALYISNWGVTHDGNSSHCYYYKDYTDSKFRLIVLDNMVMPEASDHYDSNQITWFRAVLADAITNNLSVICAWHFPGRLIKDENSTFCSKDVNGEGWGGMEAFYDAVDDFISNDGEFVCWLSGHMHNDLIGVKEGHTNQLVIAVACTWPENVNTDMQRDLNTKSQDCINLISFDKNIKVIKIVRIGADYDRYLRHKGVMCYNYLTKTLLYNN